MSIPKMDWTQVALNGEEPCFNFHPETDSQFCGRAERWAGHGVLVDAGGTPIGHAFKSLEAFITRLFEYYFADPMPPPDEWPDGDGSEWKSENPDYIAY